LRRPPRSCENGGALNELRREKEITYMIRYIMKENTTASPQYIQYIIVIVSSNQYPVFSPTPYCVMFIKIVPNPITAAGINSDSVGWRKLALKVDGYK
jgi:hypothetical protein